MLQRHNRRETGVDVGLLDRDPAEIVESRRPAVVDDEVESGGNSLLPRLREAEVRFAARHDPSLLATGLREAAAMYHAMDTPDPAACLDQELAVLQ